MYGQLNAYVNALGSLDRCWLNVSGIHFDEAECNMFKQILIFITCRSNLF
jgi:hypothetical protein